MSPETLPIDEDRRRAFEADRVGGGRTPLAGFLPPPDSPTHDGTLEELIAIDLEFRWKRHSGASEPEPAVADYEDLLARAADPGVAARLEAENDRLRAAHGPAAPLRPGVRLGRLVLRERVGRGAFAEVWRATDEALGRDVAVKMLHAGLADDASANARFRREARSAAALRHPAILTVHEVGEGGGRPYLVCDFASGGTLADRVRAGPATPHEAAAAAARLADALEYAHACGVVHRDVKPENVLIDVAGDGGPRLLLADFGLAAVRAAEASLTQAGEIVGTPGYMAPEQVAPDAGEPGPRTDVYGLGALLHHLLTGRPPFAGRSVAQVLYAVVHEDPEPVRKLRPDVPEDLARICAKAMAKSPSRRYGSAREMADDLRRFLAGEPVAARPPGPLRALAMWARRRPSLAAAIGLGAAGVGASVAIGVAGISAERRRTESQLCLALVAQAEARLAARGNDWHGRATAALAAAARCDVPERDVRALRDLVLASHGIPAPSPRIVGTWPPHAPGPAALAVSPDGSRVAVVTRSGTLALRDAATGAVRGTRDLGADAVAVVFAGDGTRIVVVSGGGAAESFDAETLAPLARTPLGARALTASARGDSLAVGLDDGGIVLLRPGGEARIDGHPGGTTALAFSPDGRVIASGGMDRTISLRDAESGRVLRTDTVSDPPRSLVFDVAGGVVAYGTWETAGWGSIDLRGGREETRRPGVHLAAARWVGRDAGGRLISLSADGTLRLWTFDGAALGATDPEPSPLVTAASSPDGLFHYVVNEAGDVRVWRFDVPAGCGFFVTRHTARFVPGTSRLATCAGCLDIGPGGVVTGGESPHADAGQVWGIAASADGRFLATTAHDGAVRLRDATTFREIRTLRESGPLAWTAAFSANGRHVAAACGDELVLFDTASGAMVATARGSGAPGAVAFHPKEPLLAVGDERGGVSLRRVAAAGAPPAVELTLVADLAPAGPAVRDLAWSPDGSELAAALSDGSVRLWRLGPGGLPTSADSATLDAGGGAAWAVAWNPSGSLLAAGTERGIVTLFCPRGGTYASVATLRGEFRRVRSLSFGGPGGHTLAAGCYVGPSAVWDLAMLRAELRGMGLDWDD